MRLNAATLSPAVSILYTVPPGRRAIVAVNLCNRDPGHVRIRLALTAGVAAPGPDDWIEYDTPIPGAGVSGGSTIQITGLALGAGQSVQASAEGGAVAAVVHGVEEAL